MKLRYLLGAALALALVPGVAAAQNEEDISNCPCPSGSVGGSGSLGADSESTGVGGSASVGTIDESGNCVCPPPSGSVGGTGTTPETQPETDTGDQTGTMTQPSTEGSGAVAAPPEATGGQNVTVINPPAEADTEDKDKPANVGLSVAATGGVEGYTQSLAPRIRAGPAWGVNIGAQPSSRVGLELNYIGANNLVDDPNTRAEAAGTRIIRNGGNVDLKISLAPTVVEPYVFGGIGLSRATVRNDVVGSGYQDDTFGQVPLGAGFNFNIGPVTAGGRFTYNLLFDQDFAPGSLEDPEGVTGDLYTGQIMLGGKF